MKVYLIASGEYENWTIYGATTDLETAQKISAELPYPDIGPDGNPYVPEFELDEIKPYPDGQRAYEVVFYVDGSEPRARHVAAFTETHTEIYKYNLQMVLAIHGREFTVFAETPEQAIEIAQKRLKDLLTTA